jgi:hypothetical protein
MLGSWKIGAQLSTSHSSGGTLGPAQMVERVQQVREAIDLDLLIVGFREAPGVFREFCGKSRPVDDVFLWYSALSDIEGMEDSDLVVNWRGKRSRGWGGWTDKGEEVEETFRFVCPNNPAAREKTRRHLYELLSRYDFKGAFLDKIRFPSPANGADELLSCFCEHCRRAAKVVDDLDLDLVATALADRAIDPSASSGEGSSGEPSAWLGSLFANSALVSRFLRFRAESIERLVAELAEEARLLGRKVSLDLFSPCLAYLVGQSYPRLKRYCDWTKPMTYRLALGPAGLRLEIPALIEGVARRFELSEAQIADWSARHAGFDADMLRRTRASAVPLPFIQAEIGAAVRAVAPVPVYFGLELVSQPGVIDVNPAHVQDMVRAGRAANAAGLIISWDLMHAPTDGLQALAGAVRAGIDVH